MDQNSSWADALATEPHCPGLWRKLLKASHGGAQSQTHCHELLLRTPGPGPRQGAGTLCPGPAGRCSEWMGYTALSQKEGGWGWIGCIRAQSHPFLEACSSL